MKSFISILCGAALTAWIASTSLQGQRTIHRPKNNLIPTISITWVDEPTVQQTLTSRYLEKSTFFEIFDRSFFFDHLLPTGKIRYRYHPEQSVDRTVLDALMEKLLQEAQNHNYTFSDFIVLRDRDFNHKRLSGLIILKAKHYPFVVKLFMETPKTFVRPFRKGFVPACCFFVGGGINRHISGFTRIKNLYAFKETINKNPLWRDTVTLPRKWFWLPHNSKWFSIQGTNFGSLETEMTTIPGIYAIVADAIEIERTMTLRNKRDREESLRLCNDVNFTIDPHIDNFMIEKGSGKIALVDTEHFPSLVGLKEIGQYSSQIAWYLDLAWKGFHDMFLRPKVTVVEEKLTPVPPIIRKKTRKHRQWFTA